MSAPRRATCALALAGLALVACGHSPEPAYYALSPIDGAPRPAAHVWELRRPTVAGYLDRERIVGAVEGYRVQLLAGDRWAEPLADMLGRVLAEDLAQRLPAGTVLRDAAEVGAPADAVVNVDVEHLEGEPNGDVALRAQVTVEGGHPHALLASRTVALTARPSGAGASALVAAMSTLVARLADEIARMLG